MILFPTEWLTYLQSWEDGRGFIMKIFNRIDQKTKRKALRSKGIYPLRMGKNQDK